MQGPGAALLLGRGQGCRVGREALQQLLAQVGLIPAQRVEGVGAGGIPREAVQQVSPQALGAIAVPQGAGGLGLALQHQGREGIVSPALVLQPVQLPAGIGSLRTVPVPAEQQGSFPAALRVGIQTPDAPQLADLQPGGEGRPQLQKLATQEQQAAAAQAGDRPGQ
jgi:hypothetical protein